MGLLLDEGQFDFVNKQKQVLSKEENKIINLMNSEPVHIDDMASNLDIEIPAFGLTFEYGI